MKYTFVTPVSRCFLFSLNCIINAAKYFGSEAEFNLIYDDISPEVRDAFTNSFPSKIIWHPLTDLYNTLPITATKHVPNKFWTTSWLLASRLLDEYDSICILQADEMLLTNVDSLFKMAAGSDVVIATEYHVGYEAEDLPFGTTRSILNRGQYALYDQLVFCGKANKQILIDTYMQQCEERWNNTDQSEAHDPLCCLNQACATHLNKSRIYGLDCNTWTWDKGAWSRRKLRYDRGRKAIYDEDVRIHGMHTKWWLNGIIPAALEREIKGGNLIGAEIIAHNYNIEREIMIDFNEMTPATKNNEYDHTPFNLEIQ
jgi:hypothetical protein